MYMHCRYKQQFPSRRCFQAPSWTLFAVSELHKLTCQEMSRSFTIQALRGCAEGRVVDSRPINVNETSKSSSCYSAPLAWQNQPFPMWTLDVASTRSRNTPVATNQDQQFPMWTPDFAGIHSRNTSVAANQNQAFPM